jgi:hypothetical protein
VNDKTRGQTISASDFRFPGLTTAKRPAFGKQLGSSGAMNCAINSSAAEERRVRRVHNRVEIKFGDIALDDLDLSDGHGASRSMSQPPSVCRV